MNLVNQVNIVEVAPRDGFQSISNFIPTKLKIQIINELIKANFKKIEVTSFVSQKALPQMKDAKEIMQTLLQTHKNKNVVFNALVPNLYGAKAAYEAKVDEITYVISASEAHNKANVRRSIDESFLQLQEIKKQFCNLKIKLAIATTFGCPYEGEVAIKQVFKMIEKGLSLHVDEICLADTIGIANPLQINNVLKQVMANFKDTNFSLHLHDTRGMGLANILVAMQNGINSFESAVGGLGGCPFAPGAAGNVASEDLINMLHCMGIETGVDLEVLTNLTQIIKEKIKPNLSSHLAYLSKECKA